MRELKNNVVRDLSFEEHKAILEAAELLQKAFKRKIYGCFVNALPAAPDEVSGINLVFNNQDVN